MNTRWITLFLLLLSAASASALWEPVAYPDDFENIGMFLSGGDQLYAGGIKSKVYGSTDLGDTWTEIAGGLEEDYSPVWDIIILDDWFIMSRDGFGAYNFRSRLVEGVWQPWEELPVQEGRIDDFTAIDGRLFGIFYGGGIRFTDDYGLSWTPIEMPGGALIKRIFEAEGHLFASENIINDGTIWRSDDLGETWTEVGAGLNSSYICSNIFWQGRLLLCVYNMGGDGTFYSSTDFGENWQLVTTLPTDDNVNAMAIADDERLVIGDSSGYGGNSMWLSPDLVEWENYNHDLSSYSASFGSLVTHDGWFFKTGGTTTCYRAPQPDPTGVENERPSNFAGELSAWPNPFNPKTTLRFALEVAGPARLDVYDLTGRRLAEVFVGELDAGAHEIVWQAKDRQGRPLASGVYLVRLKTRDVWTTEKLVLLQ